MRLPAYGRALFAEREAGRHPWHVWVYVAERFPAARHSPALVVLRHDYAPETLDFSVLASSAAHVVAARWDEAVYQIAAEVAHWAAPVYLRGGCDYREELGMGMFCRRRADPARGRYVWPPYWSDTQDLEYQARCDRWFAAAMKARLGEDSIMLARQRGLQEAIEAVCEGTGHERSGR